MQQKICDRRDFLRFMGRGALTLASTPLLASVLNACASGQKKVSSPVSAVDNLPFQPLKPSTADALTTAPELNQEILIRAGTRINRSGEVFGCNNDFTAFQPFSMSNPDDGMLLVNHEFPHPLLDGGYDGKGPIRKEHVDREMLLLGNSLLRIRRRSSDGLWQVVQNDPRNRRLDGSTKIPFANGFKILGETHAIGTMANCAGGRTPWGTFLSCEENYEDYFGEREYGQSEIDRTKAYFAWYKHYDRPPEHYGWVVEVDPQRPKAQKLIALGRFSHEGATVNVARDGRAVVYMGDDTNFGCIYKFIAAKAGSLEEGTLYAADLNRGRWIALDREQNPILAKHFSSQLDVLIHARAAARLAGASQMDRPEDIEIQPGTGNIIVALTNNKKRGNYFGSLLKIVEKDADPLALECQSDTLLSGGLASGFACPDNLAFDQNGNLWFTTDVSDEVINTGDYLPYGNNSLFYVPMQGGDAGEAHRIVVAPREAELTGISFSPDYKTLFVSVQHPGQMTRDLNAPTSRWPDGGNSLPKSALVQIYGPVLELLARKSGAPAGQLPLA